MVSLVVAGTTDLFLQSRITEISRSLGFESRFVRDADELTREVEKTSPRLVVLDLSSTDYDPFASAKTLKSLSPTPKILGFFPHVRTELRTRAEDSGIDYVVPNSGLLKTLKSILSKGVSAG